jgi:Transglycosylase SLT domain
LYSRKKPKSQFNDMNKYTLLSAVLAVWIGLTGIVNGQTEKKQSTGKLPKVTRIKQNAAFTSEDLALLTERIANENGIPAKLFFSLIRIESEGKLKAVSGKGAACYTQLMPATARRMGLRVSREVDERFDVEKCLSAGAGYLKYQLDTFKDFRLALAGYNAGEGAVFKYGVKIPPYRETIQYVEKIGFLFTGKRGHGTAFAYNYQLAAEFADAAFRKKSKIRIPQAENTEIARNPAPVNNEISAKSEKKPETHAVQAVEIKVLSSSLFPVKKEKLK